MEENSKSVISSYFVNVLGRLAEHIDCTQATPFEVAFLDSMWDAWDIYGERMHISEKQKDVLRNMKRKYLKDNFTANFE